MAFNFKPIEVKGFLSTAILHPYKKCILLDFTNILSYDDV